MWYYQNSGIMRNKNHEKRKPLKIAFTDFWSHFDPVDNYFYKLLSQDFEVTISKDPDLLIYSNYGSKHKDFFCYKLFYSGENERINWNACDIAMGFQILMNECYFRLPNWIWYFNQSKFSYGRSPINVDNLANKKFCNMVVSNGKAKKRVDFYHKLNKYRAVDSGGRFLNNVGGPVANKLDFISKYKFTLAFENSSAEGYTTEKLVEPFMAGSIPIYWGNPKVAEEFNTDAFLNYHDYGDDESFIQKIIEVDQNDSLYLKMAEQPMFRNDKMPEYLNDVNVRNFLRGQIDEMFNAKPVSQTYRFKVLYKMQNWLIKVDFILDRIFNYRTRFR